MRRLHAAVRRFPLPNAAAEETSSENVAVKRLLNEDDRFSFEVDWSGLSLRVAFQELLLSVLGLPSPFPKEEPPVRVGRSGFRVPHAGTHELYHRQELPKGSRSGFLIRGVIYDMAALIQKLTPEQLKAMRDAQKTQAEPKDWSNLLHENLELKAGKVDEVSASEVMDRLGLKNAPGLREKVGVPERRRKLEAKQALEEVMGRGDSIRAKYADRLRQKKAMADSRREQNRFMTNPVPAFTFKTVEGIECKSLAVPGSPALVRYLQERGMVQALLAGGPNEDFNSLIERLGNFKFDEVKRPGNELLSLAVLNSICEKWKLSPQQVIVVVTRDQNEEALRRAADRGFFVCRMQGNQAAPESPEQEGRQAKKEEEAPGDANQKTGLRSWFSKLSEGTLRLERGDEAAKERARPHHFSVMDMTELKWVIEDFNGVSYRPTTFVRGL